MVSFKDRRQSYIGNIADAASHLKDIAISAARATQSPTGQMARAQGGERFTSTRPTQTVPSAGEATFRGGAMDTRMNLISAMEASGGKGIAIRDITAATYESLVSGGGVSRGEAYSLSREVAASTTGVGAYENARRAIEANQGSAGVFGKRLTENIGAGAYDTTRLHALGEAVTITDEFAKSSAYRPSVLGAQGPRATEVAGRIGEAASGSGLTAGDWRTYNIKDVVGGKEVATPMLIGRVGKTKIQIPLNEGKLSYGGENLTARYYTKQSFDVAGGEFISHGENYTRQIEEALISQKNASAAKEALHNKNLEILGIMNERDAAARATAEWGIPEMFMTSGEKMGARIKVSKAAATTIPTRQEAVQIFTKSLAGGRPLFPFGGPGPVHKGVYSTFDLREGFLGEMGGWKPIERRPEQQFRERWSPTQAAKQVDPSRIGKTVKGPAYERYLYGGKGVDPMSAGAYEVPSMVTAYSAPDTAGRYAGLRGEEAGLFAPHTAPMLEVEQTKQVKLTTLPGQKAATEITMMADAPIGSPVLFDQSIEQYPARGVAGVSEGRMIDPMLGVERDTGREIFVGEGERIIGAQRTGAEGVTAYKRVARTLQPGEVGKYYGDATKHMVEMARSEEAFGQALYAAGGAGVEQATGHRVDAVIAGAILDKDPYARHMQQMEAMQVFAEKKLKTNTIQGDYARLIAEDMVKDPQALIGARKGMTELQVAENMVQRASTMGFTPEEMAMTFGRMPEDIAKKVFMSDELEAVRRPGQMVIGKPKLRMGSFAGEFASTGSFDPSTFHSLAMKGEYGQELAADLMSRVQSGGDLTSANKMMASMLGASEPGTSLVGELRNKFSGERGVSLTDFNFADEGQWVNVGGKYKEFGGSSSIYWPGRKEMPGAYRTVHSSSGEIVASPMEQAFQSFRSAMTDVDSTPADREAAAARLRKHSQSVWAKEASGGGKVLGARYLAGIPDPALGAGQVSVSEAEIKRIYDPLIERASSEEQRKFLQQQRHTILGEGKSVPTLITRAPGFGVEGVTEGWLRVDRELSDGMVSMSKEFSKLQIGNGATGDLDVSNYIRTKGDFDGDHYTIAAVSDRRANESLKKQMGHARQAELNQYFFQQQALKKAMDKNKVVQDITAMSPLENLIAGHGKLTAAQERAGLLNVSLEKIRLSAAATMSPQDYRQVAGIAEMAEQSLSVGGKHGAAAGEAFTQLTRGVEQKNAGLIQQGLETMFGPKPFREVGSLGGQPMEYSFDAAKEANRIASSLSAAEGEVDAAMAVRRMAKNKQLSRNTDDALRVFNLKQTSIDAAQVARQVREYGPEKFSATAGRTYRQAEYAGKKAASAAKRLKNPAIAVAAVGAGLLLAAPAISGTVSPPRNQEGPDGGRNQIDAESMMIGGYGMQPPPGRIMESPRVHDLSGRSSIQANANFNLTDFESSRDEIMGQANSLGQGARVRVNIKDDRSRLDPAMLAQKIHERL